MTLPAPATTPRRLRPARRTPRLQRALRAPLLAALPAVLALSACGDSGPAPIQSFGARGAPGVSLSARLTMGGTYSISATWTDDISAAATASSCAQAVRGFLQDGARYPFPRTPLTTSFDGHVVGVIAGVVNYHGPAPYDAPSVTGMDGTTNLFTVDGQGWAALNGGTAHVDVHPDGSGLLVFQKLQPAPPTPAPAQSGKPAPTPAAPRTGSITGTLSWTCTSVRQTTAPAPSPGPRSPAGVPTATPPH